VGLEGKTIVYSEEGGSGFESIKSNACISLDPLGVGIAQVANM